MTLYLTNTLTRKKEKFEPIHPGKVGVYSCGPTVYLNAHIGHMRKYLADDILVRTLKINGYEVTHVMNITDVGHLVSDSDTGEDKMEKSAREKGKTAREIADFYEKQFFDSTSALNIQKPDVICKATDNIQEQIDLVKKLEENGFTYKTSDGIYYDTSKFKDYGKMAGDKTGLKPGSRVEMQEKKHPTDFALWKFSYDNGRDFDPQKDKSSERRQMEWKSPWGLGFPGWHIECSAMSMKYLGDQFDIHTGGEDHTSVHHPNEIAQAEAATGKKPFVKYWLHTAFLKVDGTKMSKSLNNFYTVEDVEKRGFDPLSLRYLFLTAHYRDSVNFTWESLESAQTALNNLREQVLAARGQTSRTVLSREKNEKREGFNEQFMEAINDDLNTSKALAVLWSAMKSNIPSEDKYDLAISFDEVLGLKLNEVIQKKVDIPEKVQELVAKREELRKNKKFDESDIVRKEIEKEGYRVEDSSEGPIVKEI